MSTQPKTRHCANCGSVMVKRPKEGRAFGRRRFCSRSCAGKGELGTPAQRFLAKVSVGDGAGSCWMWTGATTTGYGSFAVHHSQGRVLAHRFSYEHFVGPIPNGLVLDHICQTPLCVNPDHLRPVTQADNSRYQQIRVDNSSGYRGVCFDKTRSAWMAHYSTGGRFHFVGYFSTPERAARAASQARMAAWGGALEPRLNVGRPS